MISAIDLLYGGAPEGPAGTGKTEVGSILRPSVQWSSTAFSNRLSKTCRRPWPSSASSSTVSRNGPMPRFNKKQTGSDGLDYKAMAKFFKGLAGCGSWCCFDE